MYRVKWVSHFMANSGINEFQQPLFSICNIIQDFTGNIRNLKHELNFRINFIFYFFNLNKLIFPRFCFNFLTFLDFVWSYLIFLLVLCNILTFKTILNILLLSWANFLKTEDFGVEFFKRI